MINLDILRKAPEVVYSGLERRGVTHKIIKQLVDIDIELRMQTQYLESARRDQSKSEEDTRTRGHATLEQRAKSRDLKERVRSLEVGLKLMKDKRHRMLSALPNLPGLSIPDGNLAADAIEISRHQSYRATPWEPKEHWDLGASLGLMDFETAAKMSGARFALTTGSLARLERALGQFMLDQAGHNGYTEVNPPLIVKYDALFGTGQMPKFEEDLFSVGQDDQYLIPTAEVSLTNMVADKILSKEELPLRYAALTPCFRAEAGSAGRDTRGLIRQHQFYKVELVSITTPEQSEEEHINMVICAESVLKALDLDFRTIMLPVGDMGFSAAKTYDLEVYLPGQKQWREIASISNCTDFQARRLKARFKDGKDNRLVHTLNGSGVAVGRALVAVMEQYQNPDGTITVPTVLQSYMGGTTKIEVLK